MKYSFFTIFRPLLAALVLAASFITAAAQQFPLTLPSNTVYGRLGIGTGPGQAIPFATLSQRMGLGTNGTSVLSNALTTCNGTADDTAGIQAVVSSGAKMVYIPYGMNCRASHIDLPSSINFYVSFGGSLKKVGATTTSLLKCNGDNITISGSGTLINDLSNVAIECSQHDDILIDGIQFRDGVSHNVIFVDVNRGTVRNTRSTNNQYFADYISYILTEDTADVTFENNYCDRSIVGMGECFYFVPQSGHISSRVRVLKNTCLGLVNDPITDEASCIIFLAEGFASLQFPQAVVTDNITINFNFPYSITGMVGATVKGNTAKTAGPRGYCYELAAITESAIVDNVCEGAFDVGSPFILNTSFGNTVTGNTITATSTDAGSIGFQALISGMGTGRRNIIANNNMTINGGKGFDIIGNDYILNSNMVVCNNAGSTGINLNTGSDRIVTNNIILGCTVAAIANPGTSDTLCLNRTDFTTSNQCAIATTSATAMAVGPSGTLNPSFAVDASTASAAGGLKVTGRAAASGVALSTISSATDSAMTLDSKGAGIIQIGPGTTGGITFGSAVMPNMTLTSIGITDTFTWQETVRGVAAYNASPFSGLYFQNKYNNAGDYAGMGGFGVGKENATDGNVASFAVACTRVAAGSVACPFRISSTGGLSLNTTTDPGVGNVLVTGFAQTGAVAVGSLPACAAGTKGARHFVTDSNAALTAGIGAVVAAGGANNVPVVCDGTNWRIGG